MKNKNLGGYTACTYGGPDGDTPVTHHCWLCGEQHTIPQSDWVVLVRKHRFSQKQDLRMVCVDSLSRVEHKPKFNF